MVSRSELYREKAADYADKANRASEPEAKWLYSQLAARWQHLAEEEEFSDH